MVISGVYTVEKEVWCEVANDTRRSNVEEMVGCVECFGPKYGG